MAGTVTSQLTNITLAETGDAADWDDISGGPGSTQDDGSPIQGLEVRARRIDNNIRGFSYDSTAGQDISATNTHVGFWVQVLQPSLINANGVELLLGNAATPKSGNWSGYFYDESTYPVTGGWIRIWLDPTRTRDTGSGTLSLTTIRQWGCEFDMGDVGGTTPNCQLDRIDYTSGGLLVDGGTVPSPAVFNDFVTADTGSTSNRYGVVIPVNGVLFCNARLTIADATATIFNDSAFTLVFADQRLCSADFMGLSVDLQNASTDVDLVGGIIRSGGSVNLGDFIVTGTSGALDTDAVTFDNLRALELTSGCTLTGCTIANSGAITATSACALTDCIISSSTAASALIWDLATDLDGQIDGTTFSSSGTGHAIELGTTSPTTIALTSVSFDGYAGTNGSTGNESIWVRRTSGTVTINVNGGDTPTIRTDGATVVVVNAVTVRVTVSDASTSTAIQNARVYLEAASGGSLPAGDSVSITRSGSTVTVTHTGHGLNTGDRVTIRGADQREYLSQHTITVIDANSYSYTVSGTPATPATGTITSTAVILDGLSNASGVVEDTGFAFVSNQPVVGRVRKSSTSPLYVTAPLLGTITSAGFDVASLLISDEG